MKLGTAIAAVSALSAALLLDNGFVGLLCAGLVLTLCLQIAAEYAAERK